MNEFPDIEKSVFKDLEKSKDYIAIKRKKEFAKSSDQTTNAIKNAEIEDEKIRTLLSHITKNALNDKLYIQMNTFLDEYIKNQDISEEQNEKIKHLRKDVDKTRKVGIESEKATKKSESIFNISDRLNSIKDNLSMKNMVTGLMHGAGIALDMPALNILAGNFEDKTDENKEAVSNLMNDLKQSSSFTKTNKPETSLKTSIEPSVKEISNTVENDDLYLFLEHIEQNTFDNNQTSNKIHSELINVNKQLKDYIFYRKDIDNDVKSERLTQPAPNQLAPQAIVSKEEDDDEDSLFDFDERDKKSKRRRKSKRRTPKGKLAKIGNFGGKALGMLGSVAKFAGPVAMLTGLGYGAYEGISQTNESFDLKDGQEASTGQKTAGVLGGIVSGSTFGLIDTKDATKTIYKGMDALSETGTIGFVRRLSTEGDSYKLAETLEDKGVVDLSVLGDSQIRDWEAIKKLSGNDIDSLIRYDDWSDEDLKTLKTIKSSKDSPLKINKDTKSLNDSPLKINKDTKSLNDSPLKINKDTKSLNDKLSNNVINSATNKLVTEKSNTDTISKMSLINKDNYKKVENVSEKQNDSNVLTKDEFVEQMKILTAVISNIGSVSVPNNTQQPTPSVSDYTLESNDLVQMMTVKGIRV